MDGFRRSQRREQPGGVDQGAAHPGDETAIPLDAGHNMDSKRFLIVNADDFGLSEGVNRGIIEAYERGIVTSASLMVLKPAASPAAAYGRDHPRLSMGLHLDLGEWAYDGETWFPVYRVVPLDDCAVVAEELERQLSDFRRLVGRDPTHLDSHQHAHQDEPVRSAALELARRLGVPLRHFSPAIGYCGRFYGQTARGAPLPDAISVDSLIAILKDLPPGLTELGCHPGRVTAEESPYGVERSTEVDVLSHPRVRALLKAEGIELCSFREVLRH
jgi:chitin disaccharide deacetylase